MLELSLPDMSCGHCEKTVRGIVARLAPTAHVDIDLGTRRVRIEGDVDAHALAEALDDAGYPPAA